MKKIELNLLSKPKDFIHFEREIIELLKESKSKYSIVLMRREDSAPKNTLVEVDCEFLLIRNILNKIIEENENILYENIYNVNEFIMNKIIIKKVSNP